MISSLFYNKVLFCISEIAFPFGIFNQTSQFKDQLLCCMFYFAFYAQL